MNSLSPIPEHAAKGIPRPFLQWLMEVLVRMNSKLDLLTSGTVGNVVTIAAGGEIADSSKAAPTGDFVGTTDSQVLTNKTLTSPTIANFSNAGHDHQDADDGGQLDHGLALTGLTDDDHTQYLYLTGRTGGQVVKGGNASGDDLTLQTTSHVTKGSYIFSEMTSAGYLKNDASGVVTGGNTFTVTLDVEIFTATDTLDANNDVAICNKGTAMTLTLPAATGSAKIYYIKNIGAGIATVEGDGAETIDGVANQALNQWDAITVVDYNSGVWAIL